MIVGIVHINRRQYCCGVWANIEQAGRELHPGYVVYESDSYAEDDAFAEKAHRMWEAIESGIREDDMDEDCEFLKRGGYPCGEGSIHLYEYIDSVPGYCPHDED